jgi:hypothetical protein
MKEWVDELSCWVGKQNISDEHNIIPEELYQATFETDVLLQVSDQLQLACASILEKVETVNSP